MPSFEIFNLPRILAGPGRLKDLPALAASIGRRPFIIHNTQSIPTRLTELLFPAQLHPFFHRQQGEPVVTDIERALHEAREHACDLVIAVGGGSALDAAKAIAGLLTNGGEPLDYMEVIGKGEKLTRPAAPWIAVPTTGGTGAEVTRNAVIGDPKHHFKASIRSEHLLPRAIIVDPELHIDIPPEVTARSGMDALCQCIESFTSTGANPITDPLALQGITLASRSLRNAVAHGDDIQARFDMALAALLSGITLTNAGLGAVHGIAAPLGANFPIPHGTICAALLPHIIRANITAIQETKFPIHPVLARYVTIGRTLSNDPTLGNDPALAACVNFTAALVTDLKIPPFSTFGLPEKDLPHIVNLSRKSSSMRFNPIVLTDDALIVAIRSAL